MLTIEEYIARRKKEDKLNEFDLSKETIIKKVNQRNTWINSHSSVKYALTN